MRDIGTTEEFRVVVLSKVAVKIEGSDEDDDGGKTKFEGKNDEQK